MQAPRSIAADRAVTSGSPSASPLAKCLVASLAAAGAFAVAVNPVTAVAPAEPETRHAAVALTAAADPTALVQQFITTTQTNLELLGLNASNSSNALTVAFSGADPLGELTNILTANASDPLPFVTRLLNFQAVYGDDLQVALFGWADNPATPTVVDPYQGVFERLSDAFEELGPTLSDILTYDPPATDPNQSPLTNATFEANFYFVLGLLDTLRPLITATPSGIVPLFSIPGDFLGGEVAGGFDGALPGIDRLDNVVNVLNEQTLVRSLTGPFQTVAFQVAQVLDDAQAAFDAGDTETASNELVNLPTRAVNALVNGFAPSFSPGAANWPSLIDASQQQAGLLKYVLVDYPNQLITAFGGTPPTTVTTPPAASPATLRLAADGDTSSPASVSSVSSVSSTAKSASADTSAADSTTASKAPSKSKAASDAGADSADAPANAPKLKLPKLPKLSSIFGGGSKADEPATVATPAGGDSTDSAAATGGDSDAKASSSSGGSE